jgi:hypothetical protein
MYTKRKNNTPMVDPGRYREGVVSCRSDVSTFSTRSIACWSTTTATASSCMIGDSLWVSCSRLLEASEGGLGARVEAGPGADADDVIVDDDAVDCAAVAEDVCSVMGCRVLVDS